MEDMLDAMDQQGAARIVGEADQTLDPQQPRPEQIAQQLEEARQRRRGDEALALEDKARQRRRMA